MSRRKHLGPLAKQPRPRPGPVTVTRVPEAGQAEALRLAEGDPSRLDIKSAAEVVVLNTPQEGGTMTEPQLTPDEQTEVILGMMESLTAVQAWATLAYLAGDGHEVQRSLVGAVAWAREHA